MVIYNNSVRSAYDLGYNNTCFPTINESLEIYQSEFNTFLPSQLYFGFLIMLKNHPALCYLSVRYRSLLFINGCKPLALDKR